MSQTLVKINQRTGQVVSITRNYDFSNFIPAETEQFRYIISDDNFNTVSIPVRITRGTEEIFYQINPDSINNFNPDQNDIDAIQNTLIPITATTSGQYETISIPKTSEQLLSGTAYGNLQPGELVFQTNRVAEIFNTYSQNGNTVVEYTPTVGSIGVCLGTPIGLGALQLKGTYLDQPSVAAGGLRVPGGYSLEKCNYHLVGGHFYLQSGLPSSYDPVLCCVCESITAGSSADAYALIYDNSSGRFVFKWTTNSSPSYDGFENTLNASPQGITLNTWHHIAVSYHYDGASTSVATFFNGTIVASDLANTSVAKNDKLRTTNRPFCIGADQRGNRPFRAAVDNWIVSGGNTASSLRGFAFSGVAVVPHEREDSADNTVFSFSMDGPVGTSYVPCDTNRKVIGVLDAQDVSGNCYVSMILRENGSTHGQVLFNGTCGGFEISGVCGSSYLFGYNSGAALNITGVQQLLTLDEERSQKEQMTDLSYRLLLGGSQMYGTLGKTGDFPQLLALAGSGFCGGTFTFLATQSNVNSLQYLRDDIINNNQNGTYQYSDSYGIAFQFNTGGIKALYNDVIAYHSSSTTSNNSVKQSLQDSSTFKDVKSVKGYTADQLVYKLSALAGKNPMVFIGSENKITQKYLDPEKAKYKDPKIPPTAL